MLAEWLAEGLAEMLKPRFNRSWQKLAEVFAEQQFIFVKQQISN